MEIKEQELMLMLKELLTWGAKDFVLIGIKPGIGGEAVKEFNTLAKKPAGPDTLANLFSKMVAFYGKKGIKL